MNINEITTVQDLISANKNQEEPSDYKTGKELLKQVYKLDPAIGLGMCIHIMENLLGFHEDMVKANTEAGDTKYACLWTRDLHRIDDAITLMKRVDLNDSDGNEVRFGNIND